MKGINWGEIIGNVVSTLLPVIMLTVIYVLKMVASYFGEKIKNSKLKNVYGWLNKEVVSALERIKEDDRITDAIRQAWSDGHLTKEEKEYIIELVKKDVLRGIPKALQGEVKTLLGDIEDYIIRQIKVFFSTK